ncbi:MAG: hypothetical protein ACJAUG_001591 [Halioglobus sp.]|jgi:hypothetical protein
MQLSRGCFLGSFVTFDKATGESPSALLRFNAAANPENPIVATHKNGNQRSGIAVTNVTTRPTGRARLVVSSRDLTSKLTSTFRAKLHEDTIILFNLPSTAIEIIATSQPKFKIGQC